MKSLWIALFILLLPVCRTVCGQTTLPAVEQSLKDYYNDGQKVPPWAAAVAQLSAPHLETRQAAGIYLRLLLVQSLNDEKSGVAPWRATPYWGSSGENPARNLREDIIRAVSKATLSDQAIPLLAWYIDDQDDPTAAATAAEALAKIAGPQADTFLAQLAARPHPNSAVTATALNQVAARKLPIKPDQLLPLCRHYRTPIRQAAISAAKQLGITPIPPYSDESVMTSEPIKKIMATLADLMIDSPPRDAPFFAATLTFLNDDHTVDQSIVCGWLLEDKGGHITILTPFYTRQIFEKSDQPKKTPSGTYTCVCAPVPIEQEVARVAALRQKGDPDFDLSERGGLTGQFQGHSAGLDEATLAQWLYAGNRLDLAAKILLPALDSYYEDQHFVDMVKDRLGVIYAYHMLVSFAGDRDYAQTLKWANLVSTKFAGTPFERMAAELARQVPLRADDFKSLTLPDAAGWGQLRKSLDRPHQIAYLCDRLRLLNCFQWGQPGGTDPTATQYAEPSGISDDAAWGKHRGKTELINPLVELDSLKLTVDDIPLLTPYLKTDWFLPSVEFWRDFSPERDLLRTRPIVVGIINDLAGRHICDDNNLRTLNAPDLNARIETINKFARDNAGKSDANLMLQTLTSAATNTTRWYDVRQLAYRLVKSGDKRAAPVLVQFLQRHDLDEYDIEDIMANARTLDPSALKAVAPAYLNDKHPAIRAEAALALLGTDQTTAAHKTLGEILAQTDYTGNYPEIISKLLDEKSDESRATALHIFDGLGLATDNDLIRVVKVFAAAGMPDGFRFFLRLIDLPGKSIGGTNFADPVSQVFTEKVLNEYDPDDPDLKKIAAATAGKPDQATAAVRQWLQSQIKNEK